MGKKVKKSIKKVTKKVTKVALSPITAPTKAVMKAIQGPKPKDMSKSIAAQAAAEEERYVATMQAQRDAAADLSLDNVADIRVGDAAENMTALDNPLRKKRKGTSLSSQLGIGV